MRKGNRLLSAAMVGLLTVATQVGCKESEMQKKEGRTSASQSTMKDAVDKHACKGMNSCKGKGGCSVQGKHGCKGMNECKGQGGCKTI